MIIESSWKCARHLWKIRKHIEEIDTEINTAVFLWHCKNKIFGSFNPVFYLFPVKCILFLTKEGMKYFCIHMSKNTMALIFHRIFVGSNFRHLQFLLWNLRNFYGHLFWRTYANDWFWSSTDSLEKNALFEDNP